ncbi:serine/arginine repetitive matrix protein 2-like isoform X2 [Amphibalanus amphitrite]|uniref:serine/arginine repetitive matrix protein 2-like isoform X2 n=1 Tax=Amphibalanus amphitrite TaxID=1232801 RepID=UPI001C91128F|nr:serine/arginine repetitive matrix protein 2-like isoform X2 [Amphibalanus amphitrite]
MATVSRRTSGIPQPVASRGPSRLSAKQRSTSQPRRQTERAPSPGSSSPEPAETSASAAVGETSEYSGHQQAAPESPSPPTTAGSTSSSPERHSAAPRSPGAESACSQRSQMSSLSASLSMNSSLGPGKVRAMFQARRMGGTSAQNSPVGWDKSYPLEPISKSSPPTGGRQKRTPPARSGAGKRADRSPPQQQTVSRTKGRGAPLRRTKSQGAIEAPQKRATKPAARSSSVGRAKKKPPRRQEDRNRINDELRRREGELLDKIKDTTKEPAGLKARAPRRSKSKSPAPPKAAAAAKPARQTLSPSRGRKGGGSRRPSVNGGSRRSSVKPSDAPRPPPTDPNMAQCPICTRSFAKDRLEKHQEICEKSHAKKRKVFDPVKMRVSGTESEQYLKKIKQGGDKQQKSPKKVDWRKQHEEFVANIRAAKMAQAHVDAGGSLADLPPPPPSENPDYVQCPHCERRFNEAAAERHIPKCSSISSNKGPPGKQGGKRGGRR